MQFVMNIITKMSKKVLWDWAATSAFRAVETKTRARPDIFLHFATKFLKNLREMAVLSEPKRLPYSSIFGEMCNFCIGVSQYKYQAEKRKKNGDGSTTQNRYLEEFYILPSAYLSRTLANISQGTCDVLADSKFFLKAEKSAIDNFIFICIIKYKTNMIKELFVHTVLGIKPPIHRCF